MLRSMRRAVTRDAGDADVVKKVRESEKVAKRRDGTELMRRCVYRIDSGEKQLNNVEKVAKAKCPDAE
ncbi:hypothetical protein RUM44_004806 [Polyplax serrata]|uniref:Uncharacterized protein n=1 Tax=Polyplax serrata TaxID=468196 RepID=A0ABR1B4D0_POLSC